MPRLLKAMPGADERLKLFGMTNLLDAGAYDESIAGCEVVLHVASPFFMVGSQQQIQEKLPDPAVAGIENILASCSRTPRVRGCSDRDLPYRCCRLFTLIG